jgi:hypothetical protein
MTFLVAFLLSGCFKLPADMTELDDTLVPFDNPHVLRDDVVIEGFDTDLQCPDGSPARFHMVYPEDLTEPAPVAIVLHSGTFDYVLKHGEEGPLSGPHYHATSRLTGEFAVRKVWETLGLQIDDIDPAEDNQGTLPAALANSGVVQLIPGNCWGDLWHNEEGIQGNEVDNDGFPRNGRAFASWMFRFLIDDDFAVSQGFEIPTMVDLDALYLIGLGDGGRGVLELLLHPDLPAVAGAFVDSTPDNLSAFTENPVDFDDEIEGIKRIFGEENLADISTQSFAGEVELPPRFYYLWSSSDPQLPRASMEPAAMALNGRLGVVVQDTGTRGHVLSNSDIELAQEIVSVLIAE